MDCLCEKIFFKLFNVFYGFLDLEFCLNIFFRVRLKVGEWEFCWEKFLGVWVGFVGSLYVLRKNLFLVLFDSVFRIVVFKFDI